MSYKLGEYYVRYLLSIRKVSEYTARRYTGALDSVSKFLKEKGIISDHIYEIVNLQELNNLVEWLLKDEEFTEWNLRGHRMYSSALKWYRDFSNGRDFESWNDKVGVFDVPVEPPAHKVGETNGWYRSTIIRKQVIQLAGYRCEIDGNHQSFIAESTHMPYMEGHHIIPMQKQGEFDTSLDVYSNIVCLCPVCHRRIHYGLVSDRKMMLDHLYTLRADRLHKSGIDLSRNEFEKLAECSRR